jgi:hypothetical protein
VKPRFTDPVYLADLLVFHLKRCATDKDRTALLADELRLFERAVISKHQRNSSSDE